MTNANEPAFAAANQDFFEEGLTKREYFAAMAMQGIVSNHHMIDTDNWEWLAKNAVASADALINALNEKT